MNYSHLYSGVGAKAPQAPFDSDHAECFFTWWTVKLFETVTGMHRLVSWLCKLHTSTCKYMCDKSEDVWRRFCAIWVKIALSLISELVLRADVCDCSQWRAVRNTSLRHLRRHWFTTRRLPGPMGYQRILDMELRWWNTRFPLPNCRVPDVLQRTWQAKSGTCTWRSFLRYWKYSKGNSFHNKRLIHWQVYVQIFLQLQTIVGQLGCMSDIGLGLGVSISGFLAILAKSVSGKIVAGLRGSDL